MTSKTTKKYTQKTQKPDSPVVGKYQTNSAKSIKQGDIKQPKKETT